MTEPLRIRTILVPMDFSATAERALRTARDLALQAGPTHVILAHATYLPPEIEAMAPNVALTQAENESARSLERQLIELQDAGISSEFTAVRARPERMILELARDKDVDLIVMGTHGFSGLAHVALGSIAERVVRQAPCPVLTVKAEAA